MFRQDQKSALHGTVCFWHSGRISWVSREIPNRFETCLPPLTNTPQVQYVAHCGLHKTGLVQYSAPSGCGTLLAAVQCIQLVRYTENVNCLNYNQQAARIHTCRPRRNSISKRISDFDLSEGAISRMRWQQATLSAAATWAGISEAPALPWSAKCQNAALSMHKNSAPVSPAIAVYVCTLSALIRECSPTIPPWDFVPIWAPQSSVSPSAMTH